MTKQDIIDILLAEIEYWENTTDDGIQQFAIGSVGALSNVLAAVAIDTTPEEFRNSIAKRHA